MYSGFMKKIIMALFALMVFSSAAFAAGPQGSKIADESTATNDVITHDASEGEKGLQQGNICRNLCGDGVCQKMVCMAVGCPCAETATSCPEDCNKAGSIKNQLKAGNVAELKQMIQQKQQEMEQELAGLSNKDKQKVFRNQNQVRLAVHTLLSMENLTGGIGKNVSAIAREFNNSVQSTIRAEEKIQAKSRIMRFFTGGDDEAAGEIEQEVNMNREKIQQLKRLKDQCNCTAEVKAMFQEQIQNMELEQNRLRQLAQSEKKSKGLFGWLWK